MSAAIKSIPINVCLVHILFKLPVVSVANIYETLILLYEYLGLHT